MKAKSTVKPRAKTRNPNAINISAETDEHRPAILAKTYLQPTLQGAATVKACGSYGGDGENIELSALVAELETLAEATSGGDLRSAEAMLVAQAQSLDTIFGNLARRALAQQYLPNFEMFPRLALRAQSQCRATLEALALLKNPAFVAFVRQANIANGPQQVNNAPEPPRARDLENEQNKLLEAKNGERLVSRTTAATSEAHTRLETVEKINRAKNGSR